LELILSLGKPIFADLKLWNGRRTMASIVTELAQQGVAYTNVYAEAGESFVRGVVEATEGTDTRVLGLTVLTHYDDKYCQETYGLSLKDAVQKFAVQAHDAGCHGIILPGTTLDAVSDLRMEKLVPAVRPTWFMGTGANYQQQEILVGDAVRAGADLLVCSSPIRKSDNPQEALDKVLDEMIVT